MSETITRSHCPAKPCYSAFILLSILWHCSVVNALHIEKIRWTIAHEAGAADMFRVTVRPACIIILCLPLLPQASTVEILANDPS